MPAASLWVVRHGESAGNVARDAAERDQLEVIDIAERDMDVPLSEQGELQAAALGRWMARRPADEQPTACITSPYRRAVDTARILLEQAGSPAELVLDERLREREFGLLDRLTGRGIRARFPVEAEQRARLGKFYHRPPGGESWADVVLRLRSVLSTLTTDYDGERVLLVTHEAVVMMFRYLLEQLTEEQVLDLDRRHDVANCSVTCYERDGSGYRLGLFNHTAPLEEADAPVTTEPDVQAGAR